MPPICLMSLNLPLVNTGIPNFSSKVSHYTVNPRFRFPCSIAIHNFARYPNGFPYSIYSSTEAVFAPRAYQNGECRSDLTDDALKRWATSIRSIMPGGTWWNLYGSEEVNDGFPTAAKPVTVWYALGRMWALLADHKWVLYTAFCALTIAALSEISIPSLLAASIFSAQSGESEVFHRNVKSLIFLCFASGICSGLRSGCFAVANTILVKRLRETLYSVLLVQDISFYNAEAVGSLSSRLGTDCQQLSNTLGNDVHLIVRNLLQGTGALVNLLVLSWPLALSALVICSLLSAIFLFYGRYQKKAAKLNQEFTASANKVAKETLSLIRTVQAYGTEKEEIGRFMQWIDNIAFVGMRKVLLLDFGILVFMVYTTPPRLWQFFLGGMSILTSHVSAEQLTKYVFYCEWLIYAAWRVQDNMSSLLKSVGACEKVFQLMNLLRSDQFESKGVKLPVLTGNIDFVNVSFCYPSRQMVPILENVNFSIQANEMIAIVGASGSGKSTLINLLLRLYEPTSGQILVDDFDLKELDTWWLREQIGFVGQEPHLFHMDVESNIRYGCSRNIRWEDIEGAAKQAYAHDFISSLPNGYGTIINDDLLSKGQKQRIALARAILRDPAILILDEATSALDAESEFYIKSTLYSFKNDLRRKITIIVVAHRLSTVKAADRILVMSSGQIVEIGNHDDLLHKDGLYARLLRIQANDLAESKV